MAKLSLDDRLNQIEDKISEKSFRENKGLGNEVGYYIFDYDPRTIVILILLQVQVSVLFTG